MVGAEALMRWRRQGVLVPPGDFIPLAEETGLITPLSEWAIREAARQARIWQDNFGFADSIAVNLPSRMFERTDLVEYIHTAVTTYGVPHHAIELEITETGLMKDLQNVIPALHRLNEIGVEISIDDFGTGYSSLAYLTTLPISELKIDRSFVRDLGMTPQSSAVVTAIIALARSLGLRVIAEGVENLRQMEVLHRLGCGIMQGFLFSKPQPPEDIEDWLEQTVLPRKAPWIGKAGTADVARAAARDPAPAPAHQARGLNGSEQPVEMTRPSPLARSAAEQPAAQIAKLAFRRLAVERLEPTPENYEKAYRQECGDTSNSGEALAILIERIVRGMERGGRNWTSARRKEGIQRVLAGSRSDAKRLQQRLTQLINSWDSDTVGAEVETGGAATGPVEPEPASAANDAAEVTPVAAAAPGSDAAWIGIAHSLASALQQALPQDDANRELGAELARLDAAARRRRRRARRSPRRCRPPAFAPSGCCSTATTCSTSSASSATSSPRASPTSPRTTAGSRASATRCA